MPETTEIFRKLLALAPLMGVGLPLIDESSPSFGLLDETGVLPHLTQGRVFDRKKAQALASDSGVSDQAWAQDFLIGRDGVFLKADIVGRTGAGRVCHAIVSRIGGLDATLADTCQKALITQGRDGLFETIQSRVRRDDLVAQAASQREDFNAERNSSYGRAI